MISPLTHLSRGIDALRGRLTVGWMWWRHTYTFNFAHKPLCQRFENNWLRIGHVHICRSCSLLYASAIATIGILLWTGVTASVLVPAFYGMYIPLLLLSYPRIYERFPRPVKDVLRSATGAVLVLLIAFFWTKLYWLGLLNIAAFAGTYHLSLKEYARWKLLACNGCAEVGHGRVCSGFRTQADSIRAYEMEVEEWLIRHARTRYSDTPQAATVQCRPGRKTPRM